jgi:hypothetical protein
MMRQTLHIVYCSPLIFTPMPLKPFKKGQSGNPLGRPPNYNGIVKCRKLLQTHAKELIEQAVKMALAGDMAALKLCLDRLIPPYAAEPVEVKLPAQEPAAGQAQAQEQQQALIPPPLSREEWEKRYGNPYQEH